MSMHETPRFEGSYLGAAAKISSRAIMECKICWSRYEPEEGDETRQIPPGTSFLALPDDWKCPTCDAPKVQFMVAEDPGQDSGEQTARGGDDPAARMRQAVPALEAEFREIHNGKMRDVPFVNKALHVEAVGFRPWDGHFLGVLVAPWFMNLTLLPGPGDDWSTLTTGQKELFDFPSGTYEFIHVVRPGSGGYKTCSLFSPMADFASQLQAKEVARAVMHALFDADNREETDGRATIRQRRAGDLQAAEAASAEPVAPKRASRRAVLSGRLAGEAQSGKADSPEENEGR